MIRARAEAHRGEGDVAVHYLRIGESPLELMLDDADRAYVAETSRGSVALGRATSRSFTRRALAHQLEVSDRSLRIRRDRFGRPHLESHAGVDFSVSNSGALVAVAISRSRRVGLDIEPEHRLSSAGRGPGQHDDRCSARVHASAAQHLRRWTLREAYLKEVGVGLGVPASALSVGIQACSDHVEACSFTVEQPHLCVLQALAPREYASFRHAGHFWAIVCRGRFARSSVSVRRWTAGVPGLEREEQPSFSSCKIEVL